MPPPQLVQELPLKLLKSRANFVICSFAANLDSVRGFYCSPGSGSICWYIVELFFLVPAFSFSQCIRFFISKLSFFFLRADNYGSSSRRPPSSHSSFSFLRRACPIPRTSEVSAGFCFSYIPYRSLFQEKIALVKKR